MTSCHCFARRVKFFGKTLTVNDFATVHGVVFEILVVVGHRSSRHALITRTPHRREETPRRRSIHPTDDLRKWSEREDLNLRPLVSQTSALTGLRHAPNAVPLARIAASRKARQTPFWASPQSAAQSARNCPQSRLKGPTRPSAPDPASPSLRRGRRAPGPGAPGLVRWGRRVRRWRRPCGRW